MIPRKQEEPVGVGEWIGMMLLTFLPGIGLIFLIYWAASDHTKASKRNFARASLIVTIPLLVLGAGLGAAMAVPAFQKVREASRAKLEASQNGHTAEAPADRSAAAAQTESDRPGAEAPTTATPKPPTVVAEEPLRTFRSTDGRTMEARVVKVTDETVTIRRADNREFTTDLSRFSPEDVEYFMRLRHGGGAF